MIKSLLLRFPNLYEKIESRRDALYLQRADINGSYSQHGEDQQIWQLLQAIDSSRTYVDVGCNHPFKLSNTYLLYKHGFRGICIDPLNRYERLYKKWRPHDLFVRAAIGEHEGTLDLYEFESDVLSTLDPLIAKSYIKQGYRQKQISRTRLTRLDHVLREQQVKAPLSLLSIDIEGFELSALRSIDLDHWKPELICLEVVTADGTRSTESVDYLLNLGYKIEKDLGLNILFTKT